MTLRLFNFFRRFSTPIANSLESIPIEPELDELASKILKLNIIQVSQLVRMLQVFEIEMHRRLQRA